MEGAKEFTVDPRLRFSDIIVPTMDTVRSNFMVELLVTNSKPVSTWTCSSLIAHVQCMCMHALNRYSCTCVSHRYVALKSFVFMLVCKVFIWSELLG